MTQFSPTSPLRYKKRVGPVTAGEVRQLVRLLDEGRLPSDGEIGPLDLKRLLECTHAPSGEPCAICLGYSSEEALEREVEQWRQERRERDGSS